MCVLDLMDLTVLKQKTKNKPDCDRNTVQNLLYSAVEKKTASNKRTALI